MPKITWQTKSNSLTGIIEQKNIPVIADQKKRLLENDHLKSWLYFIEWPNFLEESKPNNISAKVVTEWSKSPVTKDLEQPIQVSYITLWAKLEHLIDVLTFLKTNSHFKYNFLLDLTAVDFLKSPSKSDMDKNQGKRFQMIYMLRSISSDSYNAMNGLKIKIVVPVDEKDSIPSITPLWVGADWPEREVYDLMGLNFANHPNLKRILMPDNYKGHPLRKDFPLQGLGEDYLIQDLLDDSLLDTK